MIAELLFPAAAIALLFLFIMPGLTLLSHGLLSIRRRRERVWARFGSAVTFALLVGPTVIPLAWLISSALHQSEPSQNVASCLINHISGENCLEALMLSLVLGVGVAAVVLRRAGQEAPRLSFVVLPMSHPLQRRVQMLASDTRLRVRVAQHCAEPLFTTGWLRPRCFVDACFVEASDDTMLRAALLHERAHARAFDNLRSFAVRVSLLLNPAGFLLAPDFQRWRQAREADCDSAAVHQGGEPLALAQSIVQAAKFRCAGPVACGLATLSGADAPELRLRVTLLIDGPPEPRPTAGHFVLAAAILGALIVPHFEGLAMLDGFHLAVEQLIHPRV